MDQTILLIEAQPKALYRAAGTLALLIVIAGLIDAMTSFGMEVRDNRTVNISEWFTLFQTNRFAAFSSLGMINIINLSFSIPIYLAFNQAFRQDKPALAALASILFFIGTAVYLSSNTVLPLFAVSQRYAASTEAQKPLLEAAGRALLAQGADLTPGTFAGLFLTEIAGLLITSVMLQGKVFGKWAARAGLAGYSLMAIFFILTAFVPEHYGAAMLFAAPGGLILMAYEIMLARRFFQLGK